VNFKIRKIRKMRILELWLQAVDARVYIAIGL